MPNRETQALTGASYDQAVARAADRVVRVVGGANRAGRVFMQADYSALEMRVTAQAMASWDEDQVRKSGRHVKFEPTIKVQLKGRSRPTRFEREDVI